MHGNYIVRILVSSKQSKMEYKVIASNYPNFLMATGFYGDAGKEKAQKRIDEGYFNRYLMPEFKDAVFIVVPAK